MDLRDTPEEAAFRAELRAWIETNLTDEVRRGRFEEAGRDWSRKLHEAGYAGLTWPKEYGGASAPYSHQAIFLEEMARAEAPPHLGVIGLGMAGPTIIAHGTDAQKEKHLEKILSTEEIWCQGFSEPGCGLRPLRGAHERALALEGDHFVVDGQKVWSSFAHIADWCILVTRSDPGQRAARRADLPARRHARARRRRAPAAPDHRRGGVQRDLLHRRRGARGERVGDIGGGWQVAMTTLLHERGTLGFALVAGLESQIRKLIALAKETGATEVQRDAIAREWIGLQAVRYTNYRSLTTLMKTGIPGPEGSGAKLWWSEANQRVTKLALELLGPEAQLLNANGNVQPGYWQHQQLRSRGNTIEAGTSEILRNIIAERVLGLPRSR